MSATALVVDSENDDRDATVPLRLRDEPIDTADAIADARSRLRRLLAMSEGTEAYLQMYAGCEVDDAHMLAAFEAIVEEARHALALLDKASACMPAPESPA